MKFFRALLKEAVVFAILLFVLALFMHKGELPVRFETAVGDPAFFKHAFLYTMVVYIIVLIFRIIIKVIYTKIKRNAGRDSK